MSRNERSFCIMFLHFDRIVCVYVTFLLMRTLCDTHHKEFESHQRSMSSILVMRDKHLILLSVKSEFRKLFFVSRELKVLRDP